MRKRFPLVLAAAMGTWASPGSAGELVVIASSDPAIEKGIVVDGNRPFVVASGASVVLVSSQGRTISLDGPYRGAPETSPAIGDSRLVDSLSRLIETEPDSRSTLAAYRGVLGRAPHGRPDIWGIDIARAGTYCLRPDRPVDLWWQTGRPGTAVTLSTSNDSESGVRIRWPRGKHRVRWPNDVALSDGASYVVHLGPGTEGVHVVTRLMPELETDAHRAAWMAEHGCTRQARMVLDALVEEAL